ncbi:MAG: hypothetical protein EOL89_12290 [Actinobacteria bacterium]|nr:hypothetical protein [Actinomycetota bacterium]
MAHQSTHLRIINNTNWDISGTYKHISGHTAGAVPGTIRAGEVSGVLTASQTTLTHGAEGRWYLTVGSDNDDEADRHLQFSHCCSVAKDGNYFRVENVSPFVQLQFRFGNGEPTGAPDWGSNRFPFGGSPLGVQLTIQEQPPVTELSVLTFNTHLFKDSNAEAGAKLIGNDVVYADAQRRDEMIARIRQLNPDLVCLQEVWAESWQRHVANQLHDMYTFIRILPEQGQMSFWEELGDPVHSTSGLMVASRYPLREQHFEMYHGAVKPEDQWSQKGAFRFKLRLPVSEHRAIDFAVGTTHAFTRVQPNALDNIKTLAANTFGHFPGCDALLIGDFNIHVHRNAGEEYEQLRTILSTWGAEDVINRLEPNEYTDWPGGTMLTWRLKGKQPPIEPPPDTKDQDRIDYVVFRPAVDSPHFEPREVRVFHDWTIADATEVSDHPPVLARFDLSDSQR